LKEFQPDVPAAEVRSTRPGDTVAGIEQSVAANPVVGLPCGILGKTGTVSGLGATLPSLAELTLWLLTTLVEVFVVCLFFVQGLFRKFLFFNFYLLLSVTINTGRYAVLSHFGFHSSEYAYFYYFTDVVLPLSLFICISELCVRLVGDRMTLRSVVLWSASALLATALFGFSAISPWGYRVATRFVLELSRNIFFACCLGIALLWIWKLRNDPEDRIAARFVNVLAIYFLLFVFIYAARELAPSASGLGHVYPMMGAWLPLGYGFALVSHEEP